MTTETPQPQDEAADAAEPAAEPAEPTTEAAADWRTPGEDVAAYQAERATEPAADAAGGGGGSGGDVAVGAGDVDDDSEPSREELAAALEAAQAENRDLRASVADRNAEDRQAEAERVDPAVTPLGVAVERIGRPGEVCAISGEDVEGLPVLEAAYGPVSRAHASEGKRLG